MGKAQRVSTPHTACTPVGRRPAKIEAEKNRGLGAGCAQTGVWRRELQLSWSQSTRPHICIAVYKVPSWKNVPYSGNLMLRLCQHLYCRRSLHHHFKDGTTEAEKSDAVSGLGHHGSSLLRSLQCVKDLKKGRQDSRLAWI